MANSKMTLTLTSAIVAAMFCVSSPVVAQDRDPTYEQLDAVTLMGTVVSSTPNTVLVRLDNGLHQLFAFDQYTTRPAALPDGSRVRTMSTPSEEPGLRIAHTVAVVGSASQPTASEELPPPVPPFLRQIERDIQRQSRRYGVGVRAGVGLDPELVLVGVHARIGPIFHPDVSFRPNLEFGLGEVTGLVALNLEAVYRLPGALGQSRWSAYAGAGPGFNFTHQNFERFVEGDDTAGTKRIDFGDFDYSTSLNILGGIQHRGGTFIELKSSLYSNQSSGLRIILGYSF